METPKVISQEGVFDPEVIDKKTGLLYCGQDESFYEQVISEYLIESKEKKASIDRCYNDKNWEGYGILVHSLKSTSKMIGALGLSEIALRLEKAAKSGDTDAVERDHENMKKAYSDVTEMISRCVRPQEQKF